MDITALLKFMVESKASDLHLSGTNPPILRIDGELQRVKMDMLSGEQIRAMLFSVMPEETRIAFERDLETDFAISFGKEGRFRVNAFTNRHGSAAVFRLIPSVIPMLEDIQCPPVLRRLAELERGLVLVTGPTGSGKSTTLAAMINHINRNFTRHIITVEDPVEFFHTSDKSLINHRELGSDTRSFSRALKSSLREDPDVILVGEMRDHETIALALTAAETGHLVFGTLHSNTAAKTIDRIIDVFPSEDKEMVRAMLSSSIQGVVSQTLLARQDGGRAAAFEIMLGTNAVRNLIRENQLAQVYSMIQTGARYGMQTMEDSLNDLVLAGVISRKTADEAQKEGTDVDEEVGLPSAAVPPVAGTGAAAAKAAGGNNKKPPPVQEPDKGAYSF